MQFNRERALCSSTMLSIALRHRYEELKPSDEQLLTNYKLNSICKITVAYDVALHNKELLTTNIPFRL